MKLVIAGSRNLKVSVELITAAINQFNIPEVKELISGCAKGIDACGEQWAMSQGSRITLHFFPADWDKHGKYAGPIRNAKMAEAADHLLLIWDGESRGSKSMKSCMRNLNKPVSELILRSYE